MSSHQLDTLMQTILCYTREYPDNNLAQNKIDVRSKKYYPKFRHAVCYKFIMLLEFGMGLLSGTQSGYLRKGNLEETMF